MCELNGAVEKTDNSSKNSKSTSGKPNVSKIGGNCKNKYRNGESKVSNCKAFSWNIAGLNKIEQINNVVEKYDIVILMESIEEKNIESSTISHFTQYNEKSKDKKVNSEGEKLLKLCNEVGLKILNGAKEGDKNGEVTFVGGKGKIVHQCIRSCPSSRQR
ncbi:hypothetical protein KQX54_014418 [Cotesia glomerata]|uniref:Uncharacterized protein n=1 Tax=Cotesia glomerata TaxID=32391 RepID=A0AAV7IBY9_COTGL|nr:hypothetical protein KQX54_014418 [Cotesia glomerata]